MPYSALSLFQAPLIFTESLNDCGSSRKGREANVMLAMGESSGISGLDTDSVESGKEERLSLSSEIDGMGSLFWDSLVEDEGEEDSEVALDGEEKELPSGDKEQDAMRNPAPRSKEVSFKNPILCPPNK